MLLLLLAAVTAPRAEEVYAREVRAGLPVDAVYDVATDAAGWIWVAGPAGLFRYDGRVATRWGPPPAEAGPEGPFGVGHIAAVVDRRALVLEDRGRLSWLGPGSREPVAGPDGAPIYRATAAALATDGAIWAAWSDALRIRDAGGWHDAAIAGAVTHLWAARDGGVWAATRAGLTRLDPRGRTLSSAAVADAAALAEDADGAWIVGFDGQIWRWTSTGLTPSLRLPVDRVTGAILRGDTLWVALATAVVGVRGGRVQILGPDGPVHGGVGIALDHEGSLWIAQHDGLVTVPSPGTRLWTDHDGLPERGARAVAEVGGRVWATSWHAPVVIEPDGHVSPTGWDSATTEPCRDHDGHTWLGGARDDVATLFRLDDGHAVALPATVGDVFDLAAATAGGLWVGTDDGLLRVRGDVVTRVTEGTDPTTGPGAFAAQVLEDTGGRLWVSDRTRICSILAAAAASGPWTCDPVPTGTWIGDLEEVDGVVWASTAEGAGVLHRTADGWVPLPGARALASPRLSWMRPSPRGGVWLAGNGPPLRVRPAADRAEGWEVLETLGEAEGLGTRGAGEVWEEPDGTLWVTADGVYRIPAEARVDPPDPPAPTLVSALVDGVWALGGGDASSTTNVVEVEYAVPSYRAPDRLRFRIRTDPEAAWSAPTASSSFRVVDLAAGTHAFSAEVALDGRPWSPASAPLEVRVPRPLWLRPWVIGVELSVLAALGGSIAWARITMRRRLESERMRIAMDLHDEVGSDIGSMVILAGITADAEVDADARSDAAGELARVAADIGDAVHDVVWSLRNDAGSPEALVQHLAVRARRLFADRRTALVLDVPDTWPRTRISLVVRREIQLLAVEALHNVARHAEARHVWLRLHPGRPWRLVVEDDGRGLDAGPSARPGSGSGLSGMRRRADRIDGRLTIARRAGGGTVVTLEFSPNATRSGTS